MTTWEHKILLWDEPPYPEVHMAEWFRRQAELTLDRIGSQGWELVQMEYFGQLQPAQVRTVWKRPKV